MGMRLRRTLMTLVALGVPRAALACPVCFGQSDSPMAIATNWGVFALLLVVVGVLSGFAYFFVYLARRARLAGDGVSDVRDVQVPHFEEGNA
jgi:hypothetical protein